MRINLGGRVGWVVGLNFVFLLAACTGKSEKELLASAKTKYSQSQYTEVVIQAKNVLQKNQNSAEGRFYLGAALYAMGDFSSAEIELRKARELGFPENEVGPLLAKAMLELGSYKRLTDEFAPVELVDADASLALKSTVALAYARQDDRDRANSLIESVLTKSPNYASALLIKARFLAGVRNFNDASKLVEQVLAKNPVDVDAMLLKADFKANTSGDPTASIPLYEAVLKLRKADMAAHNALMAIYFSQKNLVDAKKHYAELLKIAPNNPQTKFYSAQFSFLDGDFAKARDTNLQLLRLSPENTKLLQFAGAVELQTGSLTMAESYFNKALSIDAELPSVRRLLAQTYLRSGHSAKAIGTLKPLLELSTNDSETDALLAESYMQQGDHERAQDYFQRAAKTKPGDVRVMTSLALIRLEQGNEKSAFDDLRSIATNDKKGVYADLALVSIYTKRREWPEAMLAIDNLERKMTDKPIPAELRGKIQLQLNDLKAARKSFELALSKDKFYYPAIDALIRIDLREGMLDNGIKRLSDFLSANPKHAMALLALADLKSRSGASKESVTGLINDAVRGNPTDPLPRMAQISNLRFQSDFKSALAFAQEAVVAIPTSLELLDALGVAQVDAGESNQALITFKKLASLQPTSTIPHMRMAEIYLRARDNDSAKLSLKRALEISPAYVDAQFNLITMAMVANKPADALRIARTVQSQRPNEAIGFLLEGDIHVAQKNFSEAVAAYTAGSSKKSIGRLQIKLYETLQMAKRQQEVDRFPAAWLKNHPKDVEFLFYLGDQALARGAYAEAEKRYIEVLLIDTKNYNAMNNLAWLMLQQKKEGAVAMAASAVALAPKHPAILDTYAMTLKEEKKLPEALVAEKKAVALAPDMPQFKLNLAKIHLAMGDTAQAKKELDALSKLGGAYGNQAEVAAMMKALTQ